MINLRSILLTDKDEKIFSNDINKECVMCYSLNNMKLVYKNVIGEKYVKESVCYEVVTQNKNRSVFPKDVCVAIMEKKVFFGNKINQSKVKNIESLKIGEFIYVYKNARLVVDKIFTIRKTRKKEFKKIYIEENNDDLLLIVDNFVVTEDKENVG